MTDKLICLICGKEGMMLKDIAKLNIKVFGKIPIDEVVIQWYDNGYDEDDIVCEECIIK